MFRNWMGAVLLALLPTVANATSLPLLDRSAIYQRGEDTFEVWGNGDQFFPSLDFANYGSNTKTTSSLDQFYNIRAGINYGLTDRASLRLGGIYNKERALRITIPKVVDSFFSGFTSQLQYTLLQRGKYRLAIAGGYDWHRSGTQTVTTYQAGKFTVSLNPYLFKTRSDDNAWKASLMGSADITGSLRLNGGIEGRMVRVHASSETPVKTGAIATMIKNNLPQTTPWDETHLILHAGLEWQPFNAVGMTVDYSHISISRSKYVPRNGYQDYTAADTVDAYLFWKITKAWTANFGGHFNSHFVLGEYPLLYNNRTSHLFDTPFGYLTAGISYSY